MTKSRRRELFAVPVVPEDVEMEFGGLSDVNDGEWQPGTSGDLLRIGVSAMGVRMVLDYLEYLA